MKTGTIKMMLLVGLLLVVLSTAACGAGEKNKPTVPAATQTQSSQSTPLPLPGSQPAAPAPSPTPLAELPPTASEPPAVSVEPASTPVQPSPTASAPTAPAPTAQQPTAPAQAAPTEAAARDCQDLAAFYGDVTIPDGSFFRAGEKFTKTWRFRNNGDCIWTPDYQVVYSGGEIMNAPLSIPFPGVVNPGEQVDISIEMQTPGRGGSYTSSWEFADPNGTRYGTGQARSIPFWVTIQVGFMDSQGVALPVPSAAKPVGGVSASTPADVLPPGCAGSLDPANAAQVIALINQAREQNGLSALSESSELDAAALSHSADMACNNFLNHTGSDGSTWYDRVAGQGYPSNRARENIYAGTPGYGGDPAGAVDWWMNSAVHRANILNGDVTEIGVGFVLNPASDYGGYYTAVFARP